MGTVLVLGAVFFVYERQVHLAHAIKATDAPNGASSTSTGAKSASASAAAATTHGPTAAKPPAALTPAQQARKQQQMRACAAESNPNGTCAYDETREAAYLECHSSYYGSGCGRLCAIGDADKPRTYTAGNDDKASSPAKCECPADNHFVNTNVFAGCAKGQTCATGYHGPLCDQEGAVIDCGTHGVQQGMACACKAGWTGPRCQYASDLCSKGGDVEASVNADGSCTCSLGYTGTDCTACDASRGYYKTASGGTSLCTLGTVCELRVSTASGATAGGLKNEPGQTKSFDMASYGTQKVHVVEMRRVTGQAACVARLHTATCDVLVTLPAGRQALTTMPLDDNTTVSTVTLGEETAMSAASGATNKPSCSNAFDKSDASNCPGETGNICAWFWSSGAS
ncbi:MAG: hypothetical protein CMN93_07745 [Synechococcus sp. CPC35]|nr:hypothetical protein [Synechococcus sp. CPC35]